MEAAKGFFASVTEKTSEFASKSAETITAKTGEAIAKGQELMGKAPPPGEGAEGEVPAEGAEGAAPAADAAAAPAQ